MNFRTKIIIAFVSVGIAFYTIWGGLFSSYAQQPINDSGAQMRIFESVLQHIQNDYVDEPNLEKVRAGALRGLAYGLDPYSSYLTAEQVADYNGKKQNTLVGIGAEFSQLSSYLYVISVIKGSPAEKAGLKAGDYIEYVDSKATRDISLYDAQMMLLGNAGSKVSLRVLRPNVPASTVEIVRGKFDIPKAELRIEDGKIGVIKVHSFYQGGAEDISNNVQNLTRQGVQKIILDLRGVAGGSLDEGAAVANLFIKEGNLAQIIGRENKILKTYTADASKSIYDGKLSVLADWGTAGAAEVVAGAILDRKRGDVVGERSFGAGTEQQLFTLRGSDGLLLTTSKWASANGNPFLGETRETSGIQPSVEVKRPETPEQIDPEELADQNQTENPAAPRPAESPKPEKAAEPEDIILKKALELMRQNA